MSRDDCGDGSAAHLNRKGPSSRQRQPRSRSATIARSFFEYSMGFLFEIESLDEGDDEPHSKYPRSIDHAVDLRAFTTFTGSFHSYTRSIRVV